MVRSLSRSASRTRRRALSVGLGLAALACAPGPLARDVEGSPSEGLVFARSTGEQSDLYRLRLSDGAVRPFLLTADRVETWPYWTDATGRLVFQSEPVPRGPADLLGWQPGQDVPAPLAARANRDERWPEWSPDGTRLVFAFRASHGPCSRRGESAQPICSGIGEVEVASGREHLLANAGLLDFFFRPSYAPDSRSVIAQRRGGDGRGSTVWLLDARGPHRLGSGQGWFEQKPFFTRSGDAVVFARQRADGLRQIVRADLDGNTAPLAVGREDADEHSARPSPTRDEVAFVSTRSGTRDVWLASFDGSAVRDLTRTDDRDEFAPRWSPDGERLVVTVAPPQPPGRAGDQITPSDTRLVVLDREGHVLAETRGMMADWMPPFR